MELKITKMEIADFNQIETSLINDFDDFWSPSILKQELQNANNLNSNYFVAKTDENEIVGFAGILNIIDEINIMNIVVKKSFRKLGIRL